MLTNGGVTLFHLQSQGTYERQFIPYVNISNATKAVVTGGGMRYENLCTVRIPTAAPLLIDVGDLLFIGECFDEAPCKERCLRVVSFSDNRRGRSAMQHWKVVAR